MAPPRPQGARNQGEGTHRNAHALIGELAEVTARNRTATAGIEFTDSGRASKRLVKLDVSATRSPAERSFAI